MVRLKRKLSFNDLYKVLSDSYNTLGAKALAVKVNDELINSITVLSLTVRDEKSVSLEYKADMESLEELGITKIAKIKVLEEVSKAHVLPRLVDQMLTGTLTIGNYLVKLSEGYDKAKTVDNERYTIKCGEYEEYDILGYYIFSRETVRRLFYKYDLEDEFTSSGLSVDEFAKRWLGVASISSESINVIFRLPVYIRLLEVKYLGGRKVVLPIKAHKSLIEKFNLLIILKRYDHTHSTWVPLETLSKKLNSFSYKEENQFAYIDAYHEFQVIPNENDLVDVKIFNKDIGVVIEHSPLIRNVFPYKIFKNSFLQASTRFVNLEELQEYFIKPVSKVGSSKASNAFERAVTWLLSLLGFKVMEIGDLGLGVIREDKYERGEADILAQDMSNEKTYVISCSLKPPRPEKVDKIANTAGYLRERGIMVEPLMFISESAGEVKRNIRRVKVLDLDDLTKVFSLLRSERYEEAKRAIIEPSV